MGVGQPKAESRQEPLAHCTDRGQQLYVLVVEDIEINRTIIAEMLSDVDTRIDFAHNGEEAVNLAIENRYDIIFMDCQMPVVDGIEATRRIRTEEARDNRSRVPIIGVSAGTNEKDSTIYFSAGMDSFLMKPFTRRELHSSIERWVPDGATRIRQARRTSATGNSGATDKAALPRAISDKEPLDRSVLKQLLEIDTSLDCSFVMSLLDGFKDQAEPAISALSDAISAADVESVRRSAHALKSMSANIGAKHVSQLANSIERNAKHANSIPDISVVSQLSEATNTFTSHAKHFIESQRLTNQE